MSAIPPLIQTVETRLLAIATETGLALRDVVNIGLALACHHPGTLTLEPASITKPKANSMSPELEAEFLRIPDAVKLSGLSRTTLYRMIKDGSLPAKSLRTKGSVRGIRLISRDVLRDVLNKL